MSDGRKWILGPFSWRKKRKAWNKTRVKYMPVKRRQSLAEEFLDSKGAFHNSNESDNNNNESFKWK